MRKLNDEELSLIMSFAAQEGAWSTNKRLPCSAAYTVTNIIWGCDVWCYSCDRCNNAEDFLATLELMEIRHHHEE